MSKVRARKGIGDRLTGIPSARMSEEERLATVERPGALKTRADMTIQTSWAQRLVYGKPLRSEGGRKAGPTHTSPGLLPFAARMGVIWAAAKADDPYADWWLIQVDEALGNARRDVAACQERAGRWLEGVNAAIRVKASESHRPVVLPLDFSTPYGFQGAFLVAEFDSLVCAAMSAAHLGIVPVGEVHALLEGGAHRLRSAFDVPRRWVHCAITRADVRQQTQRGALACSKMGALPELILQGEWRAALAPPLPSSKTPDQAGEAPLEVADFAGEMRQGAA